MMFSKRELREKRPFSRLHFCFSDKRLKRQVNPESAEATEVTEVTETTALRLHIVCSVTDWDWGGCYKSQLLSWWGRWGESGLC